MQVPRPPASLHLNMTLFICDGAGRDSGRAAKKQAAKSAKCRAGLLERSRVTDLWKRATDKEWEERLQPRVVRVERDEKEEGTCKIAEISQVPSDGLGLTSQMGAVLYEVTNYPDLFIRGFAVPRPSRKGVPLRKPTMSDDVA